MGFRKFPLLIDNVNCCLADYHRTKIEHVIASQCAHWRGNLPVLPIFSLEIVTFYHSTGGLPRRFAPRNDSMF